MIPNSRQSLIDYCLRNLGAPVLEINIDSDQIEDRVDEALQFFQEYHADGVIHDWFKHQVTQTDVDNRSVPIDDAVLTVVRVLPFASSSSTNMLGVDYDVALSDIRHLGASGGMSNYVQTQQYVGLINNVINSFPQIEFNRHTDKLHFSVDLTDYVNVGQYLIVEGYRIVDPDQYTDVYNDLFLKRYLTALIKRNWGVNLKKFEGMELPGGVKLNGQQMFDEATEELQQIEEEMQSKYQSPIDFMIG